MILLVAILLRLDGKKKVFIRYECIGSGIRKVHYTRVNVGNRTTKLELAIDKMGLDMFPTFFFFFLGDLTLIGISKVKYDDVDEKTKQLYKYEKPGLVSVGSLFKISGKDETDVDKMYLKTRSVVLDLNILFYLTTHMLVTQTE